VRILPFLIVFSAVVLGYLVNLMYQNTCTETPESERFGIRLNQELGGTQVIETCNTEELIGWGLMIVITAIGAIIATLAYKEETS
jgi:hypothetical protein